MWKAQRYRKAKQEWRRWAKSQLDSLEVEYFITKFVRPKPRFIPMKVWEAIYKYFFRATEDNVEIK